jgi:hypothetical protein
MFDTAMYIAFCLAIPAVALALIRQEKRGGLGKKQPWRPHQRPQPESKSAAAGERGSASQDP